jgi:glycosyltransferase involved in cell wall biosynthesis
MKFTIITPNYNGAEYIEECVKSVARQKVDFEHIIIDGGSTDLSLEILKKYSHLKVISEKDDGMYDAINKGISFSQGDVISFINCDDRYPDSTLSKVLTAFNNDNVDFVYGNCRFIDHFENEMYVYKVPPIFNNVLKKITVVPWAQPSAFYRRKVFDEIGCFDIKYLFGSDYHFMKRIILSRLNGVRVNKVLSEFMLREESLGHRYLFEMMSEGDQIKKDLGILDKPMLDFFYNSYRKIYNFHTFFNRI